MAYHKSTQKVVLFGGIGCAGVSMSDTWTWNGVNWKKPAT
jgi:hypothetical protein